MNDHDEEQAPLGARRKRINYIIGWIFVRPRRWLFSRMLLGSFGLQIFPSYDRERKDWGESPWRPSNLHWWILYKTVFKFCKWLDWTMPHTYRRITKRPYGKPLPWIIQALHRIGQTTSGGAIGCYECWHCADKRGCQVELSQDETGKLFEHGASWTCSTENGTDHRFSGITICPQCGFRDHYEDGSL